MLKQLVIFLLLLTLIWKSSAHFRIVNGEEAQPNSIPYQVSIQDQAWNNWHLCGGVVIAMNFVLTTAQCCVGQNVEDLQVVAGEHDLFVESGLESSVGVGRINIHPDFNLESLQNDICILQLAQNLDLDGNTIVEVRLPSPNETWPIGTKARVSGWGSLEDGGLISPTLQFTIVETIPVEECSLQYGMEVEEMAGMLCAGRNGKDACQGDGGGPLVIQESNILCGLVSWGLGCGDDNFPGVYTEVSSFMPWIGSVTGTV